MEPYPQAYHSDRGIKYSLLLCITEELQVSGELLSEDVVVKGVAQSKVVTLVICQAARRNTSCW